MGWANFGSFVKSSRDDVNFRTAKCWFEFSKNRGSVAGNVPAYLAAAHFLPLNLTAALRI